MKFHFRQKRHIWNRYFPEQNFANDVFGGVVSLEDFVADHILPESKGGRSIIPNGIPLNQQYKNEKGDNLSGTINGKKFKIEKGTRRGVGILYVDGKQVSKNH